MKHEETYTSLLKTHVHYDIYEPKLALRVKGVVIVEHDLGESKDIYDHFASYLLEHGYVVVVPDLVGHGTSLIDFERGYFGEGYVIRKFVGDIHHLQKVIMDRFPDVAYYMIGVGFGSHLARLYASSYGEYLSGVLLLSSVKKIPRVFLKRRFAGALWYFRGSRYRPGFNFMKLKPKEHNELLRQRRGQYAADITYTVKAYRDIYELVNEANADTTLASTNPSLDIMMLSGKKDRLIHGGKDTRIIMENYKIKGVKNIEMKLYEHSGHHLLFDKERDDVYKDILHYLDEHIYY